jgi:hypothetical protein
MLDFLGGLWKGAPLPVTDNREQAMGYEGLLINYSTQRLRENEFRIHPHGLLAEQGLKPQTIVVGNKTEMPWFFAGEGDYPFDILSAGFYLLSRYEEYLPHRKDRFGRYAYNESLAWREGFLHRPLLNEWIQDLTSRLAAHPGMKAGEIKTAIPFRFLPTYDIDIAYSICYKGFWRNMGGALKELITGRWAALGNRVSVLRGRRPDPFDVFGWLHSLHERQGLRPYYFFLFAPRRGRYDKNIDPRNAAMQSLVYDHAIRYPVGIHPSWRSGDKPAQLQEEITLLSKATGTGIQASRQHYIRMQLPQTYRRLLEAGIRFDFSMGYGSHNGFRASVALPFYWYDLEREAATDLLLFPFCFMEANSYFEQHQNAEESLRELKEYELRVRKTGGLLSIIWHNSFLTSEASWAAWREGYEQFLQEMGQTPGP